MLTSFATISFGVVFAAGQLSSISVDSARFGQKPADARPASISTIQHKTTRSPVNCEQRMGLC